MTGNTDDTSAKHGLTRYMVPAGCGVEMHPAGLLYKRNEVDPIIDALNARLVVAEEHAKGRQEVSGQMTIRAEAAEARLAEVEAERDQAIRRFNNYFAETTDLASALRQRTEDAEAKLAVLEEEHTTSYMAGSFDGRKRAERERDEALAKLAQAREALEGLAKEAWVSYGSNKKMRKRWRKVATARIDIARATLARLDADQPAPRDGVTVEDHMRAEIDRANLKQAAGFMTNSERNAVVDAMGRVHAVLRALAGEGE